MIDPDDPFTRHTVPVLGRPVKYVDEGSGSPIVFLSGNGGFSYQWRNIVRFLATRYRCIVPDLPGLGFSQVAEREPGGGQTISEQSQSLTAFLEIIDLRARSILVGHEMGAGLLAEWASHRGSAVAGFVAIEGVLEPVDTSLWAHEIRDLFSKLRSDTGLCLGENAIIEDWLPMNVARQLTPPEMRNYRRPYPSMKSRLGPLRLLQQFPTREQPGPWRSGFERASSWCQVTRTPKLRIHATDGLTSAATPDTPWPVSETIEMPGRHFLLEDSPAAIVSLLNEWAGDLKHG